MENVLITKDEYEKLKIQALKVKLIDETIHGDLPIQKLMELQEEQESLKFLDDKREDIYSMQDLKEIWKKEQ